MSNAALCSLQGAILINLKGASLTMYCCSLLVFSKWRCVNVHILCLQSVVLCTQCVMRHVIRHTNLKHMYVAGVPEIEGCMLTWGCDFAGGFSLADIRDFSRGGLDLVDVVYWKHPCLQCIVSKKGGCVKDEDGQFKAICFQRKCKVEMDSLKETECGKSLKQHEGEAAVYAAWRIAHPADAEKYDGRHKPAAATVTGGKRKREDSGPGASASKTGKAREKSEPPCDAPHKH